MDNTYNLAVYSVALENDQQHLPRIQQRRAETPRPWRHLDLPSGTGWDIFIRPIYVRHSLMVPEREYAICVPSSAQKDPRQPLPVLFFWHGKGESAQLAADEQRFLAAAGNAAIIVYCQAKGQSIVNTNQNVVCLWDVCFPFDGDDLDYCQVVVDDLRTLESSRQMPNNTNHPLHVSIDWSRVSSCGFSNGGLWQSVLTLRFSHLFRAICNYQGKLCLYFVSKACECSCIDVCTHG